MTNTKLDAERAQFEANYEADEFRREYDKYGPAEAAWAIWQAARSLPAQASEPVSGRPTYSELEAMYQAQCEATDRFADNAAAKSDRVLIERVAELERDLATMNQRYVAAATPAPAQGEIAKDAARLLDAAKTYAHNHLLDQFNDARECINSDTQWLEVRELFAAIDAAMSSQPGKGEA